MGGWVWTTSLLSRHNGVQLFITHQKPKRDWKRILRQEAHRRVRKCLKERKRKFRSKKKLKAVKKCHISFYKHLAVVIGFLIILAAKIVAFFVSSCLRHFLHESTVMHIKQVSSIGVLASFLTNGLFGEILGNLPKTPFRLFSNVVPSLFRDRGMPFWSLPFKRCYRVWRQRCWINSVFCCIRPVFHC